MTVYFPLYYKDFKCIADKCTHSCCIGWEISVDESTMEKYKEIGREDILCHICDGEIKLRADLRCPFLCDDGLCRIISEFGDEYTSVICREHPRFYHKVGDRCEGGIGLSCEEAARIILSSDNYDAFYSVDKNCDPAEETEFNTNEYRNNIYRILKDRSLDFHKRIEKIRAEFSLSDTDLYSDDMKSLIYDMEYLNEDHRGMFNVGLVDDREENCAIYERFFAYLIFRHMSIASSYDNMRAVVGFSLILLSILESGAVRCGLGEEGIIDLARIISEEIEYSEENTASLIFEIECII